MNFEDEVCRAVQNVLIRRLSLGDGLFLRSSGDSDGQPVTTVIWISPASSLRFEYDDEKLPELNEKLAETYWTVIKGSGGLVLPSQGEIDSWRLEDEVDSSIDSDSNATAGQRD
ncbi:hypothetical protein M1D88_04650 [Arthrobacter sp. R1-13]